MRPYLGTGAAALLAALAAALGVQGARAQTSPAPTSAQTAAATGFADFALASEFGSGIYSIDGRVIQVYQLPLYWRLRHAEPRGGRPGIKLIFPTTFGFFNFQPKDLLHLEIPTSVNAFSLEPGVELDYWLSDVWHIYPYIKAGGTWASSSKVDAYIYGTGVRSDYRFEAFDHDGLWRAELVYAGVDYRTGTLANTYFTRVRNGVEMHHNFNATWDGRRVQLAPYLVADYYLHAPEDPASGLSSRTLQYEVGLMLGVTPMWEVLGLTLPRLGLGYRIAGDLSGWRLVIGDPF